MEYLINLTFMPTSVLLVITIYYLSLLTLRVLQHTTLLTFT